MKHIVLFILGALLSSNAVAQTGKTLSAAEFQQKLNREFRDPQTSPLKSADRAAFKSLDFFKIDSSYVVVADFVRTPHESPFEMPTTTDRKPVYVKYGELYFELEGREFGLNVYQNLALTDRTEYKDYLFLPFTDLTNGISSYSGGRYLDTRIPKGNRMVLDFNKAYNPYCAYNGEYSCPIPPAENHLALEIEAGVKDFKK